MRDPAYVRKVTRDERRMIEALAGIPMIPGSQARVRTNALYRALRAATADAPMVIGREDARELRLLVQGFRTRLPRAIQQLAAAPLGDFAPAARPDPERAD
jgi:hypothetical protein